MRFTLNVALASAAALLLGSDIRAQLADLQPGRNFTAVITFGSGKSENGDFGDVDNDGDLDCVTANGGDGSVAQLARIFINDGSGTFADQTGTRFAGFIAMQSRDIELVDIDGNSASVRLTGMCADCPSAHMTLFLGVEAALRRDIPEFEKLRLR